MDEALTLFTKALEGTGVMVRADGDEVVFFLLDRAQTEAGTYKFLPPVYHRIDPFLYGVRFACGFEPFVNEAVQGVVALTQA